MTVWAVMKEIADGRYGFRVEELFTREDLAQIRVQELKRINRGINYMVADWSVKDRTEN